jgi:hypothetical protein
MKNIILSEYKSLFIKDDGTAWANGWITGTGSKVVPYLGGHKFITGQGGLYNILLLKDNGDVYVNNPNNQTLTFLQYDSSNIPFKAKGVECQMRTYIAIRDDGTIWAQGYNSPKWFGTNTSLLLNKWTKLPGQSDIKFKSVIKGVQLMALAEDGTVYMLADGSSSWTKKDLPGKVERIFASTNGSYIVLINGLPFGWGQRRYLTGTIGAISTYEALSNAWNLDGRTITDIGINDNAVHFITSDNKLYGFGDNAQGEVGVGWELVNRKEIYKGTQYIWNWINATQPNYQSIAFISKPVQIAPDIKFKRIFAGGTYSFYRYAEDIDDNLYSWGRNKAVVLGNGVAISNESIYPNALDVLTPTLVDPFSYTIPLPQEFILGSVSAGLDQTINKSSATLIGSATPAHSKTFTYTIIDYKWSQISGPSCIIENENSSSTKIIGMTNGTYVFELKVTDNNTATMTDTVSVVVEIINNPPIVNVKDNQIVIGNCTTLIGEAKDSDGNITSTTWSKLSGSEGDKILDPSSLVTEVRFSLPGTYIYRLSATDNNGETSYADITINVIFKKPEETIIIRQCDEDSI